MFHSKEAFGGLEWFHWYTILFAEPLFLILKHFVKQLFHLFQRFKKLPFFYY